MPVCPACEAENLPDSPACRRCGLATDLFEPIRSAVGLPKEDPRYELQVRELIEAMGDLASGPAESVDAALTAPSRFPALAPAQTDPLPGDPVLSIRTIPKRPSLPAPAGIVELRHQIDEYLRLGHRLSLDEAALEHRSRELAGLEDAFELDRFSADLFVRIAAALTDAYGTELARRGDLAGLLPTGSIDEALSTARAELELGRLPECDRSLRGVVEHLDRLEEEWGPATLLLMEAEDLAAAIRELGGNPSGALGPLSEGRRLIRGLDRVQAESVLARATLALWTILNPILEKDLTRRIVEVRARKAAGADVDPVLTDLKEFAEQVTQRNFSAAVAYYRRGVDRLVQLAPADGADVPALNTGSSVPPA